PLQRLAVTAALRLCVDRGRRCPGGCQRRLQEAAPRSVHRILLTNCAGRILLPLKATERMHGDDSEMDGGRYDVPGRGFESTLSADFQISPLFTGQAIRWPRESS